MNLLVIAIRGQYQEILTDGVSPIEDIDPDDVMRPVQTHLQPGSSAGAGVVTPTLQQVGGHSPVIHLGVIIGSAVVFL